MWDDRSKGRSKFWLTVRDTPKLVWWLGPLDGSIRQQSNGSSLGEQFFWASWLPALLAVTYFILKDKLLLLELQCQAAGDPARLLHRWASESISCCFFFCVPLPGPVTQKKNSDIWDKKVSRVQFKRQVYRFSWLHQDSSTIIRHGLVESGGTCLGLACAHCFFIRSWNLVWSRIHVCWDSNITYLTSLYPTVVPLYHR